MKELSNGYLLSALTSAAGVNVRRFRLIHIVHPDRMKAAGGKTTRGGCPLSTLFPLEESPESVNMQCRRSKRG